MLVAANGAGVGGSRGGFGVLTGLLVQGMQPCEASGGAIQVEVTLLISDGRGGRGGRASNSTEEVGATSRGRGHKRARWPSAIPGAAEEPSRRELWWRQLDPGHRDVLDSSGGRIQASTSLRPLPLHSSRVRVGGGVERDSKGQSQEEDRAACGRKRRGDTGSGGGPTYLWFCRKNGGGRTTRWRRCPYWLFSGRDKDS
jgi:hypothetical protein